MRWLGLIGMLIALAACGGGGNPAADAAKQQYGYVVKAQWGRQWELLHPAQQAVVSKDAFINCNDQHPVTFDNVEIVDHYDEQVTVPEVGSVSTQAVTVKLTAGTGVTATHQTLTVHELKVDKSWRWTLDQSVLDAYRAGRCP